MNLNGVEQSLIAVKHSSNKVVYSTLYWVILNLFDRGLTFLVLQIIKVTVDFYCFLYV